MRVACIIHNGWKTLGSPAEARAAALKPEHALASRTTAHFAKIALLAGAAPGVTRVGLSRCRNVQLLAMTAARALGEAQFADIVS